MLTSVSSYAQEIGCQEKLLPYNRHSGLHQLLKQEWPDQRETFDAEAAKEALNWFVFKKLFCRNTELKIKIAPICAQTIADIPQSLSCFVFTNLGTFVITRDNGRNVNFIFQKDKTFSEDSKPK